MWIPLLRGECRHSLPEVSQQALILLLLSLQTVRSAAPEGLAEYSEEDELGDFHADIKESSGPVEDQHAYPKGRRRMSSGSNSDASNTRPGSSPPKSEFSTAPPQHKRPRQSTGPPYFYPPQDYPDYELPVRPLWPPPQEPYPVYPPNRSFSRERGDRIPGSRGQQGGVPGFPPASGYIPAQETNEEYVVTRPRIRSRRPSAPQPTIPNDIWVRTNGAYPELINLRALGSNIRNIGLLPIDQPVQPVLPVENFPLVPYPDLTGYPEQAPYEGYGSYRSKPTLSRVVGTQGGEYGRYDGRGGAGYGIGPINGYNAPDAYGNRLPLPPRQPPQYGRVDGGYTPVRFGSYPRERTWRNIPSPYGYSYAGYIERQSRMYPIMIYTLESCPACNSAKRLLAVNYADIASHFLEIAGDEEWQRQLHIDLQNLTGSGRFPYIFVCGQFIGGAADIHELHRRGQLRNMLISCTRPYAREEDTQAALR